MKKIIMLFSVIAFSSQVFAANTGKRIAHTGYIVKEYVSAYVADLDLDMPGNQTIMLTLYVSNKKDQKFNKDLINTEYTKVIFTVDGGTGTFMQNIIKENIKKQTKVNIIGFTLNDSDLIYGLKVTDELPQ